MKVKIADYARAEGISVQRARELARKGKLSAQMEGGSWVVDAATQRAIPSRRPLAEQSQNDLIVFLNTRSFTHTSGQNRVRLAKHLRTILTAENPAQRVREFFADNQDPQGLGGAAIVRAAFKNKDDAVNSVFRRLILRENLPNPADVARKVHTARLLKGISQQEAADLAGITVEMYRALELRGEARLGSVTAVKVLKELGAPAPPLVRARTTKKELANA